MMGTNLYVERDDCKTVLFVPIFPVLQRSISLAHFIHFKYLSFFFQWKKDLWRKHSGQEVIKYSLLPSQLYES